jgi:CBS-domain-containing membrane protein
MAERLLVRDLMTIGVASCPPNLPVADLARLLLDNHLEAVIVLNDTGHGVGFVSQDDLVRIYSRDDRLSLTAEDVMNPDVPQVPADIPLIAAAQIMRDQDVRVLFITHHADGRIFPAGVITYRHYLRHLAAQDQDDLADLGIKAARQAPLETFYERRDAARRRAHSQDQE